MEKKPTILSFLSKVFMIFGITMLILNIFVCLFGEDAKNVSTIFSLGSDGLSIKTIFQFLLAVFVLVTVETIFMTEAVIKKMNIGLRTALTFLCIFAATVLFVVLFGWFPVDKAIPWILFIVCFALSAAISTFISVLSEKQENQKLEEALRKFKEGQ